MTSSSCQRNKVIEQIERVNAVNFTTSRFITAVHNPYRDVQFLFYQTCFENSKSQICAYLQVCSLPFLSVEGEKSVFVELQIDEQSFVFEASILNGGQRLSLPESYAKRIEQALRQGSVVQVKAGRYQSQLKIAA